MSDPAVMAASIAREHFAWCRRSRKHSLAEIAESIGMTLGPQDGEDDVVLALERRWLQIRRPAPSRAVIIPIVHRTQRNRRAA